MNTSQIQEDTQDHLEAISEQIEEGIRRGKFTLAELQESVMDKTKAAARTTDEYVHDNPWTSVAASAGLGLIIGWLLTRR